MQTKLVYHFCVACALILLLPWSECQAMQSNLTKLTGRFLANGHPVEGVQVQIEGWAANDMRVKEFGEPSEWHDPAPIVSSPNGVFVLEFEAPMAYQFTLKAKLEGFGEVFWHWDRLLSMEYDLGNIVLRPSGRIEGRVVDQAGNPLSVVLVYADYDSQTPGAYQGQIQGWTDKDGRFSLANVPVGIAKLSAHSEMTDWIEGPHVVVGPGETGSATIVYSGPACARRILVAARTEPFGRFMPHPDAVRLFQVGSLVQVARLVPGSHGLFSFEDVDDGAYSIKINDPQFLEWSISEVCPGSRVQADLVGSVSARLIVIDGESETPIYDYQCSVRFNELSGYPNVFTVRSAERLDDGWTIYNGLVPGGQTLVIEARDYTTQEVNCGTVGSGEMVEARILLARSK